VAISGFFFVLVVESITFVAWSRLILTAGADGSATSG